MLTINRYCQSSARICLILVYMSFYMVQLNLHFGVPPGTSFFSGDFVSQYSGGSSGSFSYKHKHKESRSISFRLNKRFHPSHLFTAPEKIEVLVRQGYRIQSVLLNEEQPLTNFFFNSPSLRGPPAII